MERDAKIYVAGHRGLVGSALVRRLREEGYGHLVLRTRDELDLTRQAEVETFFRDEKPEYVFMAAARVGGIAANAARPADFIRDNLAIELNVVDAAHRHGVDKLLFLGSSCIYPKMAPQPLTEDSLLTGPLEPTNRAYAIAKIAGVELCRSFHEQHGDRFISVMPTNLYGPGDDFGLETSHVIPALLRKFHEAAVEDAETVTVWGTGTPRREFLHVDDLARACLLLMREYESPDIINVGTGEDLTIAELAELVADVTGFEGEIVYDTSRPDGTPRKVLDVSRIEALGWRPEIGLREGLERTLAWYREHERPTAP